MKQYGELGDGNTEDSQTPVLVKGLSEVVAISEGASHNLALLADGTVMAGQTMGATRRWLRQR